MGVIQRIQHEGQSLWLAGVTRKQLYNGSLMALIEERAVSGLSLSLQSILHTLSNSSIYDAGICKKLAEKLYGDSLACSLILEDVHHAADLLNHVFDCTDGVDGWAALPVSPLQTGNPKRLLRSVTALHEQLNRENILITVPGLPDMTEAIEEMVFAAIPINISLIEDSDLHDLCYFGYFKFSISLI